MVSQKILRLSLVFILIIISLAGCSKSRPTGASSPAAAETLPRSDASGASQGAEPVKGAVTIWTNLRENSFEIAQRERFKQKYPNITLNSIIRSEDAGNDFMTTFLAGNAPGYCETGQPTLSRFIYSGATIPLDGYIAEWEDIGNIRKDMLDNFKADGIQYAIPMDSYVMVLVYNKRMFAEAGIENPPTTWDELLEDAKLLTKPEKQQWGLNLLLSQWAEWWFECFVWQAGGDLTKEKPDGTVELTFTDPAVEKAITFYRRLVAADVIQPDLTLDYNNMQKQFAEGRAGMTLCGSDGISTFVSAWGMNPDDIGYAPLPKGPNGQEITLMGGNCAFITAGQSPEDEAAAWTWLTFKMSKEEQEERIRYDAVNNAVSPLLRVRNDIDYESLGKVNPELQAVVDRLIEFGRLEFYAKGIVGGYVNSAVQKTVFNPGADIYTEFRAAQDLAYKEAANQFNDQIRNGK